MPSSKRNKSKKPTPAAVTSAFPPQSSEPDGNELDDLFAELDLRDKQLPGQDSKKEPQDAPTNKTEEKIESNPKMQNSKMRHLARQVRVTCQWNPV